MKTTFLHGLLAGLIASAAAIIYNYVYTNAYWLDFSEVINPTNLVASSVIGGILASLGYLLIKKVIRKHADIIFNFLFVILSFLSFLGPLAAELPLEIDSPEMFAGLTIPMHLFPLVAWMTVKPIFDKKYAIVK